MTIRHLLMMSLLICLCALGGAAYLQYVEGLEPCSMCRIQRWMIIILTLGLIIAILHRSHGRSPCLYGAGLLIFSNIGGFTAARQVWLQHLPTEKQPACGPSFNYLMENFPLTEALRYIFAGDGNCAVVDWTFLGQSLAVWSLLIFVLLGMLSLLVIIKAWQRHE